MTERQMRNEIANRNYNNALQTKEVSYLGCIIRYKNPYGYGYFAVETPWTGRIKEIVELEQYTSIAKAKATIKKYDAKMKEDK